MVVQNLKEGKDLEVGEDLNNVDLLGGTIVIEVCPTFSKQGWKGG